MAQYESNRDEISDILEQKIQLSLIIMLLVIIATPFFLNGFLASMSNKNVEGFLWMAPSFILLALCWQLDKKQNKLHQKAMKIYLKEKNISKS